MTSWNLNQKFSTHDHDNDQEENTNCAWKYYGAWWYKYCTGPNLNGKFNTNANGSWSNMSWNGFTAIKRVQMLIRPNLDD
ncbi:fibrinogen C domain-containing protein 1-A [Drosophila willistoni]|uniref:fibrinogen C domain-containing protein 1-A n=1 Tax=Drosophila willistoni TaxID=7260 RepID=UPI001F078900|nr:fibrinogen C domain-containing protein 1-A [Drosophila willistoni]